MAFRRTVARSLWAGKNAAASASTIPKIPAPMPPARQPLPAVDDCPTLAFLRPCAATVRYSTVSVPLPAHCFPAFPVGDQLFSRLRLDGLMPPTTITRPPEEVGVTVEEARKVARAAEMEVARTRLRSNAQSVVSGSEFAALCVDIAGGSEGGHRLVRALDESGVVIVLGDAVFLRPDMVAKAIGSILPATTQAPRAGDDARKQELQKMEELKAAIDASASAQVRRELWCGLGLLAAQTLGFMRLTFWELSWDVMEPVCFYVTSLYFMFGYAFFMRTATEPSFEGFFRSRFASRQRRLMRARRFDVARYNALKQGGRYGGSGSAAKSDCGVCDADVLSSSLRHGRRVRSGARMSSFVSGFRVHGMVSSPGKRFDPRSMMSFVSGIQDAGSMARSNSPVKRFDPDLRAKWTLRTQTRFHPHNQGRSWASTKCHCVL